MIKDNDQSSHALQRVRDNCNYFGIFKNNRAVGFHARKDCRLVKIMIISLKPIIMLVKKNGFSQVLWVFQKGEMHDFTAV